jgi:hypothetical protein
LRFPQFKCTFTGLNAAALCHRTILYRNFWRWKSQYRVYFGFFLKQYSINFKWLASRKSSQCMRPDLAFSRVLSFC